MNVNPRAQRTGRANERTYSAERLKEMVKVASIVAKDRNQRVIECEIACQFNEKVVSFCF